MNVKLQSEMKRLRKRLLLSTRHVVGSIIYPLLDFVPCCMAVLGSMLGQVNCSFNARMLSIPMSAEAQVEFSSGLVRKKFSLGTDLLNMGPGGERSCVETSACANFRSYQKSIRRDIHHSVVCQRHRNYLHRRRDTGGEQPGHYWVKRGNLKLSLRAIALHGIYESNFCIINFKY